MSAEESTILARNSRIEWTTHTFNPWWGCVKVSEACKHCYAETWAKRVGQGVWGPKSDRRFFGERHWQEPLKWNKEEISAGTRARVFCASMADVFEDRSDLEEPREQLWQLIEATPQLDWLLLTKRPEEIESAVPWSDKWPENVWIGTTVENQKRANERLPYLARIPAAVRFVSAEPLLGELDLSEWLQHLDWVITGGETGPKARPTNPSWFRSLLTQCKSANIAFHFKQWGDWGPEPGVHLSRRRSQRVQDGTTMFCLGKKYTGRALDGAQWDGLPQVRGVA